MDCKAVVTDCEVSRVGAAYSSLHPEETNMARAVRFHRTGSPEVLALESMEVGRPGPGQVRLRHEAIGLNYADTYFRNGTYAVPLPSGIGVEAAGIVEENGPGVTNVQAGDKVSYTGFVNTLGAYSDVRLVAASALIRLPDGISCETAAAMTMRGLTAAYLMRRIHAFKAGDTLLLHAAAGGLGLIVSQWARLLGITVIGTASGEEKGALARSHGCTHVIDYSREDVARRVRELTDGRGVDVVFDSVGRSTFMGSLDSLRRRGLMVCVGTASGTIPPFDPQLLAMKGSLFLTRPALADYVEDPAEKSALAAEIFGHVAAGRIEVPIHQRYALEDAVRAHTDLEARRTTGASILIP
jgi:NADPH2:quinone reductase